MRAWVALLGIVPFAITAYAVGCTSSAPPRRPDALDCTWAADKANCWRVFVAGVDKCLGQAAETGFEASIGVLTGPTTCAYDGGRSVVSVGPLIPPPPPDVGPDAADAVEDVAESRDYTITQNGVTCLHFVANDLTASADSPDAHVSWQNDGKALEITCPDGTTFTGLPSDVIDCLGTNGELPGYGWLVSDASVTSFALLGMNAPAFACQPPDTGAGDAADGG